MRYRQSTTLLAVSGVLALAAATGIPPLEKAGTDVWRPAVDSDSVPSSIAEAELQGNNYPRSSRPASFEQRWLDGTGVATAERRCVTVGEANSARSGEIIGANFRAYADFWRRGAPPKLAWGGGHPPAIGEPVQLIIKAARLDAPAPSHVLVGEVETFRWPMILMAKLLPIQWFHAAVIDPPSPGRWLLVAHMGVDWGCFVLDLPPMTDPSDRPIDEYET